MSESVHCRVLVAENDPQLRRSLTSMLENAGYVVSSAEHGLAALFLVETTLPDIIIYELKLPQVNGHDFLALVRTRFPQTSVIAISSSIDGNDEQGEPHEVFADSMFARDHITPEMLLETVSELFKSAKARAIEHQRHGVEAFLANQRARRTAA